MPNYYGCQKISFNFPFFFSQGSWWYKSIQYSCEQILLDTNQLYYYFFHKTPSMQTKRM